MRRRPKSGNLLSSLNDSELFYRALPEQTSRPRINDAKKNVSSTITNELGYANAYCMVSGSDYSPYSSEVAHLTVNGVNYSETDGLVEIMANIASLKGTDTAKITSSIDPIRPPRPSLSWSNRGSSIARS
jgi:hypothetical protein